MCTDCQLYIVKWLGTLRELFNPVLSVSANEISFDKKISQSDCVFQLLLGLEEHYSPSPLGDFNRLFEGLIGVFFKLWHLDMIHFLNAINLAPKILICIINQDLLAKASWMQCPLHNQKVNKPGYHGASSQLAPSNIWTHKVQNLLTAVYW